MAGSEIQAAVNRCAKREKLVRLFPFQNYSIIAYIDSPLKGNSEASDDSCQTLARRDRLLKISSFQIPTHHAYQTIPWVYQPEI